jgi:hypothetical protein
MHPENLIKKFTLSGIGLLIFLTSFCQKNYLPGFIVQFSGDTLHGFVDYLHLEKNSKVLFFKIKLGENMFKYTPINILGFGILDEFYEGAIIKTDISQETLSGLNLESDTVFLQTMFKGPRSIYYYQNKYGKDQFYIKNDTTYELLVYKKYYKNQDSKIVIVENKKYIGQLFNYLQDCPSIQSKLNTTEYTKKGMESLFVSYYELTQSNIQFQKKAKKISIEMGILTGLSITSLKFEGTFAGPIVETTYPKSVNFSTGLFFDIILPKKQGRLSSNNELIFTSYKMSALLNYYSRDKYSKNYTEIGYSYLKINNMLRYKYPIGSLFVFFNVGISNGFVISETNYLKIERTYYSEHTIKEVKAIDDPRKYEQGYILGLGTKYKKFSFEIRNEKANGVSNFTSLSSPTNRYYFLLGYRF